MRQELNLSPKEHEQGKGSAACHIIHRRPLATMSSSLLLTANAHEAPQTSSEKAIQMMGTARWFFHSR